MNAVFIAPSIMSILVVCFIIARFYSAYAENGNDDIEIEEGLGRTRIRHEAGL
jgi:nucleoside recognition membrane protein YjiH